MVKDLRHVTILCVVVTFTESSNSRFETLYLPSVFCKTLKFTWKLGWRECENENIFITHSHYLLKLFHGIIINYIKIHI